MTFRKFALALAFLAAPLTAQALTVQAVATNSAAWNMVNPANSVSLPNGGSWTSAPLQMPNKWFPQVDPCISFCSPFDPGIYGTNQTIGEAPLPGWQNIPFWATWQSRDRSNVNVLSFNRAQASFSLLWGSMDSGNLIEFLLNGTVIGSVAGNGLPGIVPQIPGRGAVLVRFVNLAFDEVRFSSTRGGFEFANATASQVPLPLPIAALAGGLGLLGLLRRRRRS